MNTAIDRPAARRRCALVVAVLLMAGIATASAAEDTRPSSIVYDTPGPVPSLTPSYRQSERIVRLGDHTVEPRSVRVGSGQHITWVSDSRFPSTIVFEREVARSMVCHGLVNFSIVDDELRSADLHAGDAASFCELAPGRYRYRVVRRGHHAMQSVDGARRLEGWILVEGDSHASAP